MNYQKQITILLVIFILLVFAVIAWFIPWRQKDTSILKAGFTAEFIERHDGYPGLSKFYGFRFPEEPRQLDPGLMYRACAEGTVDVICGFATDGRIAAYDLLPLEDDLEFFPPYYAASLVRADLFKRHPNLEELLNRFEGKIDDEDMRRLNLQVDRENNPRQTKDVAYDFLLGEGLIDKDAPVGDGSEGVISVGGKDFTEQDILGEVLAQFIERNTALQVRRRLHLGGTMICFNALKAGDIDLYIEYTGTGLVSILGSETSSDPDDVYEIVQKEFAEQWNLIWMPPLGFNNTYTITMRKDHARLLGIKTISDLSRYINKEPRIIKIKEK